MGDGGWSERRRRLRRVTLIFGGLLFGNEVLCNLLVFRERLGSAKVMRSLGNNAELMADLVGEMAWMIAVAAAASLLLGWAAAGIGLAAWERVSERVRRVRSGPLMYWSGYGFAFFHSWYSVHNMILPGSRLKTSWIFRAVGAMEKPAPFDALQWVVTLTALALFALVLVTALRSSQRLRRGLGLSAAVLTLGIQVYSRATDIHQVTRFERDDNVILLGLDSFQLNRLPLGGATVNLAPHVNTFLEESYRFEGGWTPFARTYPSWMSILTGRFPARHGVRFNLMPDDGIAPDNPYLGTAFRQAGYATFHGTDETRFSIIREQFGFDELLHPRLGIEDFVIGTFFDFSTANLMRQTYLGHDMFPAIADNRASVSYNADIWVRSLLKTINAMPTDRPLFAVMHLCSDHWPFTTHAPFSFVGNNSVESSIAMADHQVGLILDYLEASGLRERSAVALLSDHGDGYNGRPEDPNNTHGDDFNRLWANQIILGFQGPGIPRGVSRDVVRTVDIHPTVLDLAGVPYDPASIDGRSLLPALRGERLDPRPVFAETGMVRNAFTVKKLVEQKAHFYAFSPDTGLMHMKNDAVESFMGEKSFMMIEGEHRMVIKPSVKQFRIWPFDPASRRDAPGRSRASAATREHMLVAMADAFGFDADELLATARQRGFLESPVARAPAAASPDGARR